MRTDTATRSTVYLGREPRLASLERVSSGKVRDIYRLDAEHLVFVTSDRVSAFDVVMNQGVAHKGRVLTAISAHWFERTRDLVPNHLVSTAVEDVPGLSPGDRERLRGRIMIVRRAEPTPVEWVVRGYLAGSGWKDYRKTGSLFGLRAPSGLTESAALPAPVLTPTTKDAHHDLPISHEQARERVGAAVFDRAHAAALGLFARATDVLAKLGILLADTKFEFGLRGSELLLIDEALTPDSSRFWAAAEYRTGISPPSYDKQILRDWLEQQPWNKEPPPPDVEPAVLERVSQRYLEICRTITGALPPGV